MHSRDLSSGEEADMRPLSVGRAIAGTRAFVIDEDGRALGAGEIGELVVEGPHVMNGYWRDELNSSTKLLPIANGRRLHTGDLFRTDNDGFLYFVSRRDDIIKTRGEKVSPQEVERILYALTRHSRGGCGRYRRSGVRQLIRAYVALEPDAGLSEKDILRHCAAHLEDYMVPKSVEFRDALPKTSYRQNPPYRRKIRSRYRGQCRMTNAPARLKPTASFSAKRLVLDAEAEIERICEWLRVTVAERPAQTRGRARPFRRHRFQRDGSALRPRARQGQGERRVHAGT